MSYVDQLQCLYSGEYSFYSSFTYAIKYDILYYSDVYDFKYVIKKDIINEQ